ncbi:MAG: TetR/AcrR family transcriptional regulator [Archangium sp.]|nr:TetR/AcrR family transcriptional regulator [Archangium sp.]
MSDDLRARVLQASVELVGEAGVAGLSLREVARRAGVSHQAPYHHFADKEAIVAALVELGFSLMADRMEAADGKGTVVQRLAKAGRVYVDFALEQPVYFRLMFRPELVDLSAHPSAAAAGERAMAILRGLITERLQHHRPSPKKLEAMVSMHWSLVHGLASLLLDGALGQSFASKAARQRHVEDVLETFADAVDAAYPPR